MLDTQSYADGYGQAEWGAISTIDGRNSKSANSLRPFVSEYGLAKHRAMVEAAWVLALVDVLPDVPSLSAKSKKALQTIASGKSFSVKDMAAVKAQDAILNHDVKAVEMVLRQNFINSGLLKEHLELIHFGVTSEDINNLAEAISLKEARSKVLLPAINDLITDITKKAKSWSSIAILGHTHGQPATPTTLGKEFAVFVNRITRAKNNFANSPILGKINGATGGYNAMSVVYPEVNWPSVAKNFVESLGLQFNPITTQIEPHDWIAEYLHRFEEVLYPMVDLSKDCWLYISYNYLSQIAISGEVGSSTMPHKVNPISFENAEANFETSINLADGLAKKLTQSRLQRDLSDSSSKRVIGVSLAYALVAITSLMVGLSKITPNTIVIKNDLNNHWEVLTEPVQQLLRRYNIPGGYDLTKKASRGTTFTKTDYQNLLKSIKPLLPNKAYPGLDKLTQLTPETYIGYSKSLVKL